MAHKLADMNLLKRIDEGQVIISDRGIYRQVDLYERGGQLFAAHKDGFVRLLDRENTTVPSVTWKAIEGVEVEATYKGPAHQSSGLQRRAA
jgi:hypothetical protein